MVTASLTSCTPPLKYDLIFENEKIRRGFYGGYKLGAATFDCYFRQKLLNNVQGMGWGVVVFQDPDSLGNFGPHTEFAFAQQLQDTNLDLSNHCLSGRNIFTMDDAADIEKKKKRSTLPSVAALTISRSLTALHLFPPT